MKKKSYLLPIVALIGGSLLTLGACGPKPAPDVKVTAITITGDDEAAVGVATQYEAIVLPDNAKNKNVTWSVDDEDYATIDQDGVLTALKAGSVTITATAKDGSGVKDEKTIRTINKIRDFDDIEVDPEATEKTYVTVEAVVLKRSSKNLMVYDDTGYVLAYLNDANDYKEVAAVGKFVRITGYLSVFNASYELKLDAYSEEDPDILPIDESITPPRQPEAEQLTSNQLASITELRNSVYLEGLIKIEMNGTSKNFRYRLNGDDSYNDKFGYVSFGSNPCTLTGTEVGDEFSFSFVVFQIKNNNYVTCGLSYTKIVPQPESVTIDAGGASTVNVGGVLQLNASVSPAKAPQAVVWEASNANATVDEDGLVSGVSAGEVTITATCRDHEDIFDSIVLNVVEIALDHIEVNASYAKQLFEVGETFTSDGLTVDLVFSDGSTSPTTDFTTDFDGHLFVDADISHTKIVTVTASEKTDTYEISVIEKQPTKKFEMVTSVNDLVVGKEYTFAYVKKNSDDSEIARVALPIEEGAVILGMSSAITLNEGSFESKDAESFVLGGEAGAWTFSNANGTLGVTEVKKLSYTGGTTTWTIAINEEDNKATISSTGEGLGRMLANVSSPRFTTYTNDLSETMVLPVLFELCPATPVEVEILNPIEEIKTYASYELRYIVRPATASQAVVWSSDNAAITVENGVIKGVTAAEGVTITVKVAADNSIVDTMTLDCVEELPTSLTIQTSSAKTEFEVGEIFTSEGLIVVANYADGSQVLVETFTTDMDSKTFTEEDLGKDKDVTVHAMGITGSYKIDVVPGKFYEKLSDVTDVISGKYLISAKIGDSYKVANQTFASQITSSDLTVTNEKVSKSIGDSYYYNLEVSESGVAIKNAAGKYIAYSSSTSFKAQDQAAYFTLVAGTNGTFRLTFVSTTTRGFFFRGNTTNKFGAYASSNVTASSTEYFDLELFLLK